MGILKNRRALVTAGGQGIGKAIVEELARQGCHVAFTYLSSERSSQELAVRLEGQGLRALCLQADLTNESQANQAVDEAVGFLGGLDVLVNNAGTLVERRLLGEVDVEYWRRVMEVNVTSMMLVTRRALEALRKAEAGSSVVNLSSIAGERGGGTGPLAYSSGKGAVLAFTRTLSTELAQDGVRVNAVAPGLILGSRFHDVYSSEEAKAAAMAEIPLGRAGRPEDVARVVAYLASEYDGFITGATIDVNGGVYRQ